MNPVIIETDPKTGFEIIYPGKCYPPPAYIIKKMNKKKNFLPRNRFLRIIWKFFKEGF